MLKTSPKKYQDILIPSYRKVFYKIELYCHWRTNHPRYVAIGCRRILYDVGYLAALHRLNINLRSNDIETIVEDSIVTKAGNGFLGFLEESLSDVFLQARHCPLMLSSARRASPLYVYTLNTLLTPIKC